MELELKHIIPYFDHGLFIYSEEYDVYLQVSEIKQYGDFKIWCHISDDYNKEFLNENDCNGWGFKLDKIKPLLKPLKDLLDNKEDKKHITPHSLHFIENNFEIKEILVNSYNKIIDQALYSDVEYLLSQHYDVFDLIDNELAYNLYE